MARFVAGVVAGIVITTLAGAALGLRAQDPSTDVQEAAAQAGVDPQDLAGAVATTGVDAYTYLRGVGELPVVVQSNPRAECIIRVESRGNPGAVNPRSGASGLGQFLRSTWLSTPQGRAGLSVFDPVANRAAVVYMLAAGRAREFVAVSAGYC